MVLTIVKTMKTFFFFLPGTQRYNKYNIRRKWRKLQIYSSLYINI